jgi:hypothetical protein
LRNIEANEPHARLRRLRHVTGEPDDVMALTRKPRRHGRADEACRAKKQHFHGHIPAKRPAGRQPFST